MLCKGGNDTFFLICQNNKTCIICIARLGDPHLLARSRILKRKKGIYIAITFLYILQLTVAKEIKGIDTNSSFKREINRILHGQF